MVSNIWGIAFFFSGLSACIGPKQESLNTIAPSPALEDRCVKEKDLINWDDQIGTLNRISRLFQLQCYQEVIKVGGKAREKFRSKTFSIIDESLEFFVPEGTVSDYVLESYERGYLSFLISLSYLHLDNQNDFRVAMNRFYREEIAFLYNHGQDPVNTLLQAVLWDNYPREGFSSRPFWLKLSQDPDVLPSLTKFARLRIAEIDQKKTPAPWSIAAVGRFPRLDWNMKFIDSKSGYFEVKTSTPFPQGCVDEGTVLIPTTSWFKKIAMRHSRSYHPLVNAKSWIRLPVGILYGISTITAGASVIVGGCALDGAIDPKGSGGALCRISIEGGLAIMGTSDDVVEATLRPDLRHWETVPAAFVLVQDQKKSEQCLKAMDKLEKQKLLPRPVS